MFKLIGVTETITQVLPAGHFESNLEEEEVAVFTTKEKAETYIENSRLKKPSFNPYTGDVYFKNYTLLEGCCTAYIKKEFPVKILDINPTIK
jgi:hypothetical protein